MFDTFYNLLHMLLCVVTIAAIAIAVILAAHIIISLLFGIYKAITRGKR